MRQRIAALLAAGLLGLAGAAGCGEEDVERGVDQGAEEAGQAAEDAGQQAEDAANEAEGAAEDAANEAEREVEEQDNP